MRISKQQRDTNTALRKRGLKTCSKCRATKDIVEFRPDMAKPDGLARYCRPCHTAYQKVWAEKHREKTRAYNQARYDQDRERRSAEAKEKRKARWISITVRQLKAKCLKRGLDFDLDLHLEKLEARFNRGMCEMTGIEFRPVNEIASGAFLWNSPSFDRRDPKKGYVYDNVRLVIWLMNAAMSTWGEDKLASVMTTWLENRL